MIICSWLPLIADPNVLRALTCLTAANRLDVINVEQARIAEDAGAVAVMALERIPADIRVDGGVARMSDPKMIREIKAAVSIPVMAKVCGARMSSRSCTAFVSLLREVFVFVFFRAAAMPRESCRTSLRKTISMSRDRITTSEAQECCSWHIFFAYFVAVCDERQSK